MKKVQITVGSSRKSLTHNMNRASVIFGIAIVCFFASMAWSLESVAQDPHHGGGRIAEEAQSLQRALRLGVMNRLGSYTDALASRSQRTLMNGSTWRAQAPEEHAACVRTYDRIFADGIMKVNIAFGYSDMHERTLDAELYETSIETFTRSCTNKRTICGFKITAGANSRKTVLEKSLLRPIGGDTANLQEARIRLTVTHSSANSINEDNFYGGKPSSNQVSATKVAEKVFFGGIRGIDNNGVKERCDVCVYYGHARDGGGPDFGPVPRAWRTSDGKINYDYYHKYRTNYKTLLSTMAEANSVATEEPPALVAILACYSHSHFWKKKVCADSTQPNCKPVSLADYSQKTGFVLTTNYSWFENYEKTFGSLMDTLTGLKCSSSLKTNFNGLRGLGEFKEEYGIYGSFLQ